MAEEKVGELRATRRDRGLGQAAEGARARVRLVVVCGVAHGRLWGTVKLAQVVLLTIKFMTFLANSTPRTAWYLVLGLCCYG